MVLLLRRSGIDALPPDYAATLLSDCLTQARRAEEARPHLERSLELARGVDVDYEVALTLEALGRTGLGGAEAEAENRAILDRLGVLSTPLVPLP